jgi:hypothetical protein
MSGCKTEYFLRPAAQLVRAMRKPKGTERENAYRDDPVPPIAVNRLEDEPSPPNAKSKLPQRGFEYRQVARDRLGLAPQSPHASAGPRSPNRRGWLRFCARSGRPCGGVRGTCRLPWPTKARATRVESKVVPALSLRCIAHRADARERSSFLTHTAVTSWR